MPLNEVSPEADTGALLARWADCDAQQQAQVIEQVYAGLRQLAARSLRGERADHTLRPTDLANEAYLRLRDCAGPFHDRAHLLAIAALLMRRILIDHARARLAGKRNGLLVTLDTQSAGAAPDSSDLLALDTALTALRAQNRRHAEVLEMTVFGGLSQPEIAQLLGVSLGTIERDLRLARAYLKRALAC